VNRVFHHFTTLENAAQIFDEGLRLGQMLKIVDGAVEIEKCCQWLTTDGEFEQKWAAAAPHLVGRTEVRLSVVVPLLECNNLQRWIDVCGDDNAAAALKACGGCEDWWVFKGVVEPSWIKAILTHEDSVKGNPGYSELCACGALPTQKLMNGKALDMAEDVCDNCYSEKFRAKVMRPGGLH